MPAALRAPDWYLFQLGQVSSEQLPGSFSHGGVDEGPSIGRDVEGNVRANSAQQWIIPWKGHREANDRWHLGRRRQVLVETLYGPTRLSSSTSSCRS